MSNQIIYNNEQGSRFLFRYGLQNEIRNLLKNRLRIFLLHQICSRIAPTCQPRVNDYLFSAGFVKHVILS